MIDVVCAGEALVDLVASRRGALGESPEFRRYAGGAPANVARAVARLGGAAGWMWTVGDDEFGRYLLAALTEDRVDVSRARLLEGRRTGISFVALDERGERTFSGYGFPDASMYTTPDDIDEAYVASARIFHFGSTTMVREESRLATLTALAAARSSHRWTCLDVNFRLHLWADPRRAVSEVRQVLPGLSMVKASDDEAATLTGAATAAESARVLVRWGAGLAVVTLGERGSLFATERSEGFVGTEPRPVVDSTGAGDSFLAGLLVELLRYHESADEPGQLPFEHLRCALEAGNRAGGQAVTVEGAVEWR